LEIENVCRVDFPSQNKQLQTRFFLFFMEKTLAPTLRKKTKHHTINKTFGQHRPIPPTEKTPRSTLLEYTSFGALLSR